LSLVTLKKIQQVLIRTVILKSHKNFHHICDEIFFAHDTTGIQTLQQEEMTTPVTRPVTHPESAENVDTASLEADKSSDAFINLDLPVNHINNHLISVSQSFSYIKGVPNCFTVIQLYQRCA